MNRLTRAVRRSAVRVLPASAGLTLNAMGGGLTDPAPFDAALAALVRASRSAEIDAAYAAHDRYPLDEPDEWGDLASFRDAAAES